MRIFRHTDPLPGDARGSVVAIGNFDGLHRGHRAVVARTREIAAALGAPSAALTFEPHPRRLFDPEGEPFRLSSLRAKARRLEALGLDLLFVQHFDHAFARIPAAGFVSRVLVGGLGARHIVVGEDFAFGHRRQGNVGLLREMAAKGGFAVTPAPQVLAEGGTVISSNTIRQCLREGDPGAAAALLGHPWEVDGRVIRGEGRGHDLGFPTANIDMDDYLRPQPGIYAVRAGIDEGMDTRWHDGAASYGVRPHFGGGEPRLEVHLMDFRGDLYGRHLRVAFAAYLRGERAFPDTASLIRQMEADVAEARAVLAPFRGEAAGGAPRG
ncbi:MAG TPA: bifunctional riboflavin kinase/FAD synthetase [Alphaproteobacteria bacterium]